VPWETIIKTYRRELGEKTYSRLEDYAHGLIRFLSAKPTVFRPIVQLRDAEELIKLLFENVRDDIYEKLKQDFGESAEISEEEVKKATSTVIEVKLDIIRKQELIRGLPKNIRVTFEKKDGSSHQINTKCHVQAIADDRSSQAKIGDNVN